MIRKLHGIENRCWARPTALLFPAVFVDTIVGHNEPTVSEPRAKRWYTLEDAESPSKLPLSALQPPLPEGFQHSDHSKETWGLEIEFRCGSALCSSRFSALFQDKKERKNKSKKEKKRKERNTGMSCLR